MRKTYTKAQISDFYHARKMQVEAGIIEAVPPSSSTFEAKITYSLYCLCEQVESDTYETNWKKRKNGHAWLSYDGDMDYTSMTPENALVILGVIHGVILMYGI